MPNAIHPWMKRRETALILTRLQALMRQAGFDYLILTERKSIYYVTGYLPLVGASIAVMPVEGDPTLIISTLESGDARAVTDRVTVKEFLSWVFIDDGTENGYRDKGAVMDPEAPERLTCQSLDLGNLSGFIGLETAGISHSLYQALARYVPEDRFRDCAGLLARARMQKTPWEIGMVRYAAQCLERVYEALGASLEPGMPESYISRLFTEYSAKFDKLGVIGRNQSFIPAAGPYYGLCGMPRGYVLQRGDIVKFDVGFEYLGFNSDIARTYAVGGWAKDEDLEIYDTLYRANRLALSHVKPGVPCSEIYRIARESVESSRLIPRYPRGHMGHSVGCAASVEEYPQLATSNDEILRPGMTFSLETPYSATFGAPTLGGFNLEDTFVVTETGFEPFTQLPDNLFGHKPVSGQYVPPIRIPDVLAGKTLVDTPEEENLLLEDLLSPEGAHLFLLGGYGSAITKYDLRQLASLSAHGVPLIAAVQSTRGVLLHALEEESYPFPILCDPEGALSRKYSAHFTGDPGPATKEKRRACEALGLTDSFEPGEPDFLPAAVLLGPDGSVLARYVAAEPGGLTPESLFKE